jgi:hypothetical protein
MQAYYIMGKLQITSELPISSFNEVMKEILIYNVIRCCN